VAEYSRLLLYATRRTAPDYDASMDAYAFVLEKLRENELRRLRRYAADGRGKFTTWLVVVTRRLCLDYHRHRYGRAAKSDEAGNDHERAARRRLADLTLLKVDDALAAQLSNDDPEGDLRRTELERALDAAMNGLPAPDRLLLALRFHDGLSAAEIASLLHYATPFHVYRRINQLLADLRQRLIRLGVQSSAP
jgi:RNA polymerase sigma factor (sigma-70 family)